MASFLITEDDFNQVLEVEELLDTMVCLMSCTRGDAFLQINAGSMMSTLGMMQDKLREVKQAAALVA